MPKPTRRLTLLVTRLLDLARADMAVPEEGSINAEQVIARVAASWRTATFAIEVVCDVVLPEVRVPATTLEAVLVTLLENSRQANARLVTIRAVLEDTSLELLVFDDGRGAALADRARLFEPFFTTKRDKGGTGLGLAISRSLLEAASGELALTDGEALGFMIRLPINPCSVRSLPLRGGGPKQCAPL
jgi:signal transduction histidine kinase